MTKPRAAVIYHPIKLSGKRGRRTLERAEKFAGRPESIWIPTQADDTRDSLLERITEAGVDDVDVLIAAGGDGTVRLVASVAAAAGKAMGVWPIGSTNLFARNLSLPVVDTAAALRVALTGEERAVDMVGYSIVLADGTRRRESGLILAGFGIDAQMVRHTSDAAKKQLGWLAYVDGVRIGLTRGSRFNASFSVDGAAVQDSRFLTFAIGNGGVLPAGLVLLEEASVEDGKLDVLMLRPDGVRGWREVVSWFVRENSLVRRIQTRLGKPEPLRTGAAVEIVPARVVKVKLRHPEDFQIDGEYIGQAAAVRAEIEPGALKVRLAPR